MPIHAERDTVLPLSVCLSVQCKSVQCHTYVILMGHHSSFFRPHCRYKILRGTPSTGPLNTRGRENLVAQLMRPQQGSTQPYAYIRRLCGLSVTLPACFRLNVHGLCTHVGCAYTSAMIIVYVVIRVSRGCTRRVYVWAMTTLIGNHTRSTEWYSFQWPWVTADPISRSRLFSTLNISETARDRAIVTIERQ